MAGVIAWIAAPTAILGVTVPPGMLLLVKVGMIVKAVLGGMLPSCTAVPRDRLISMPMVIYATYITISLPFLYRSVLY